MGSALVRALVALLLMAGCGNVSGHTPVVLLDAAGSGSATETFTAHASGWDLHWSYDCGGRGVFTADVFDAAHTPDFKHPGVNEEGVADSGVYHVPETGRFYLEITSTCEWTVKVLQS